MVRGKSTGPPARAAADGDRMPVGAQQAAGDRTSRAAALGPPRVLYIDADDDLSTLLDRIEEAGSPAIVVLPEGARGVRGAVAARLLKRRADAAGIPVVVVTTDRTLIGGLGSAGIRTVSTVGEARLLLPRAAMDDDDPLAAIAWDGEDDDVGAGMVGEADADVAPAARPDGPTLVALPIGASDAASDEDDEDTASMPPAAAAVDAAGRRSASGRRPWRLWLAGSLIGLVAGLLVAGAWLVFFPAATVTITYALHPYDRSSTAPLGEGPGGIPLYHTHLSMSATATVPGTGTRLVPDGRAGGAIALANPLNGVVRVPAGTVVDAQSGARFVTVQDVLVPGAVQSFSGTTNGQATVVVQAVQPGPAGNVADHTITRIEGRLAGALLVTNPAPMTGGTERTVYSLTAADTSAPVARMTSDLAARETQILGRRYARSPIRLTGTPRAAPPSIIQFSQGNRPYARITLTVRTDLTYVHGEDIQKLAAARRDAALAGLNQRSVPGSERLQVSLQRQGKTMLVLMHEQALIAPVIDAANLRALLIGRTESDARQLLDGSARNGGWSYVFRISPDAAHRFPQAAGLITISVRKMG